MKTLIFLTAIALLLWEEFFCVGNLRVMTWRSLTAMVLIVIGAAL